MKRNMMDVTITEASYANVPVNAFCKSTMDQINESTERVSLCRHYSAAERLDKQSLVLVSNMILQCMALLQSKSWLESHRLLQEELLLFSFR